MKLLLDIGQNSIKFALVKHAGKEAMVLKAGLEDSLERILPQLPLQKGEYLNVSVLFSPSISKARMRTYVLQRENPKERISVLEEKILEAQAVLKIQSQVEKSFLEEFGILPKDFLCLKFRVLYRTVDGYDMDYLEGLKGENVFFEGLAIFCLRSYWEKLLSFFAKYRVEKFSLLHEAQCVLEFARRMNQDGAFVNVGEKITHLCVVRDHRIVAIEEIPYGGWEFTNALAHDLGITDKKAEEYKKDYAKGVLREEVRRRIRMIFLSHAKNWGTMIQEKLAVVQFSSQSPLFLYGGGARLKEIHEVFGDKNVRILTLPQSSNPQYTPLFLQLYAN